jgi:hypothetical protein
MAPPIQPNPQNQPPAPVNPAAPVAPAAPLGVGGARDTLAPEEIGATNSWIVKGVLWIWDRIYDVIQKVCCCFFKAKPPAAPAAPAAAPVAPGQPPAAPPPEPPPRPNQNQVLLDRLRMIPGREDLLYHFEAHFPTEVERNGIYLQLGEAAGLPLYARWYSEENKRLAKIEKGRNMVLHDPWLIRPHLMLKLQTALNNR